MRPVIDYRLSYNIGQNGSRIEIHIQNDANVHVLQINSDGEFLAVAHMLQKGPVAYDPINRVLMTNPRQAGT